MQIFRPKLISFGKFCILDETKRREEFSRAQGIPLDNPMSNRKEKTKMTKKFLDLNEHFLFIATTSSALSNNDQSQDTDYHRNEEQVGHFWNSSRPNLKNILCKLIFFN